MSSAVEPQNRRMWFGGWENYTSWQDIILCANSLHHKRQYNYEFDDNPLFFQDSVPFFLLPAANPFQEVYAFQYLYKVQPELGAPGSVLPEIWCPSWSQLLYFRSTLFLLSVLLVNSAFRIPSYCSELLPTIPVSFSVFHLLSAKGSNPSFPISNWSFECLFWSARMHLPCRKHFYQDKEPRKAVCFCLFHSFCLRSRKTISRYHSIWLE